MKKILSLIICALMIVLAAVPVFAKTAGIAGDVNKDGGVDNKDVVSLFRRVSGGNVDVDEIAADCNGDGTVDNKDVVILFRFTSGQDVEITYGPQEIVVPEVKITYVTADIYADKATAEKEGYTAASNDRLSKWFSDKAELDPDTWEVLAPKGFNSVSEYVIRRARGQYIEEVTVLKVKNGGSLSDVRSMAEFRCSTEKENADYTLYDDEDHRNAKMLNTGKVVVAGNFVIYAVTENTEVSILRARKYVQDHPDCTAAQLYKAIVCD